MASKLDRLNLQQLYELPKITPSVERRIIALEDFTKVQPTYCETVCKLRCKSPDKVRLSHSEVDVLILQDHKALRGKFDKREGQQEEKMLQITEGICREAGFKGLRYKVVTLLKCDPNPQDFVKNKPPTMTKMLKCKPYLVAEIKASKPKVIISTTTACTRALGLAKASNAGDRGKILDSEFGPVVVTQHPRILTYIRQNAVNASSGYWSSDFYGVIVRDFAKAARLARGQLQVPKLKDALARLLDKNIHICRSLEDVKRYTDEILSLPPNTLVSWDIETTGFSGWAKDAKLLCTQFAYRKSPSEDYTAVVIPLWHRLNTFFNADEAWKMVVPILEGPTKITGWNVKFDRVYTAACTGVMTKNIVLDGLLMLHMLDSGVNGTYSLKSAVIDFMPESGLAGYEDTLPKLTKKKPDGSSMEAEEEEEEEESDDEEGGEE